MAENDGHQHEWYWSPETGELRCKMCRAFCDPIDRIADLERQNAAAMAIVREMLAAFDRPGTVIRMEFIEQARALVAGETREEAGE